MAATIVVEKKESRRVGINGQGEDREKIWIVETDLGPPEAKDATDIPAIGDAWPDEDDMICISVEASFSYKSDIYIYCEVVAQYSDYRQDLLQNPGDMTLVVEMAAGSYTVRSAPRVVVSGDNNPISGPAGGWVYEGQSGNTYVYDSAQRYLLSQDGMSGASAYKPQYNLRITKLLDDDMTDDIYLPFYELQGFMNGDWWNGADRGRILFLGGEMVNVGRDRWTANMTFVWDSYFHNYRWFPVDQQTGLPTGDIIYNQLYPFGDFNRLDINLATAFPGKLFDG